MWHASGKGRTLNESRRLALLAVNGVGDASLGEWQGIRGSAELWHVQRRLSAAEREQFAIPEPVDVRDTAEDHRRIAAVLAEAPHLAPLILPSR